MKTVNDCIAADALMQHCLYEDITLKAKRRMISLSLLSKCVHMKNELMFTFH